MFFTKRPHNNIDFLRSLAVVSVFIHHAQAVFGGNFPFFGDYGGQFGPQLFFLISGYLIFASYQKYSLREYTIHRAFRIFPAYWFYFIGVFLFNSAGNLEKIATEPLQFIVNLLLLQQIFPAALINFDMLHVTWTLTVELFWYIGVPLIYIFWKKITLRLLFASIILSTIGVVMATKGNWDFIYSEVQNNWQLRYLFLINSFPVQFCFFVMGAFIYCNQQWLQEKIDAFPALLLSVFIFLLKPYYLVMNPLFITGLGLFFLMVAAIQSKPLQSKIVFLISEISFSIYLCHFPVMLWVQQSLKLQGIAGVALSAVLTLLLATLSYVFIERTGMNWGRKLAQRQRR
ncbi:MAG: hypothetical protein RIR79_2154 [Pseudomonadota bacterium]|jgi:peptidoglycan/LPS O-acetylase OafA/YrhL